jgi:hypothetical protein
MGVVQEEHRLHQAAVQAAAPPVPTAPQVEHPACGPKIGAPEKFDGSWGAKANAFLSQANQHMFPTDLSKVVFILSYLSGPATLSAQLWMEKVMAGDTVVSAEEFHSDFSAMYGDSKKNAKAEAALRALKQTKLVAHYTHQFNLHAHNAGWETSTLISQYKQGLKTQIRLVLLMIRTEFAHLSEVANLALNPRLTMRSTG